MLQADKYASGQPATFEEGDWNLDRVFDQLDLVAALQSGNYRQGPYAAITTPARYGSTALGAGDGTRDHALQELMDNESI